MLNYHTVVSTAVDLLERAVPDPRRGERQGHPSHIAQAIRLVQSAGALSCTAIAHARFANDLV